MVKLDEIKKCPPEIFLYDEGREWGITTEKDINRQLGRSALGKANF